MPQHDLGSGPKGEEKPQDGGIHEQGDDGWHDKVGNETIDGKGAEVIGNKGRREEGARKGHHKGGEQPVVGTCKKGDADHRKERKLETNILQQQGIGTKHDNGSKGKGVGQHLLATEGKSELEEGGHEGGTDERGRHACDIGKYPEQGYDTEHEPTALAVEDETEDKEVEQTNDKSEVHARKGEYVADTRCSIVTAQLGCQSLTASDGESLDHGACGGVERRLVVVGVEAFVPSGVALQVRTVLPSLGRNITGGGDAVEEKVATISSKVGGVVRQRTGRTEVERTDEKGVTSLQCQGIMVGRRLEKKAQSSTIVGSEVEGNAALCAPRCGGDDASKGGLTHIDGCGDMFIAQDIEGGSEQQDKEEDGGGEEAAKEGCVGIDVVCDDKDHEQTAHDDETHGVVPLDVPHQRGRPAHPENQGKGEAYKGIA